MKNLTKTLALISAVMTLTANAEIAVTDTDTTSFDIGGEILPECKVSSYSPERSTSLDLSSSEAQTTASVSLWCNTGQGTANTTYASANAGFMVNENGQKIAYTMDVSGTASDLSLTSAQTVRQISGSGVDGAQQTRSVKIKPIVTGFEYAGVYSDTIEVTVSYN